MRPGVAVIEQKRSQLLVDVIRGSWERLGFDTIDDEAFSRWCSPAWRHPPRSWTASGKGSFYATDLETLLRSQGIERLVITGVTTEVCVQSTAREANDRGFDCLILSDYHRASHAGPGCRGPGTRQRQAGPLHELLQPDRLCFGGDPGRNGLPVAVRHHAHRPRRIRRDVGRAGAPVPGAGA
ncbi:MAG: cysteine hydrolase family protein [Propioniciclava sp.]